MCGAYPGCDCDQPEPRSTSKAADLLKEADAERRRGRALLERAENLEKKAADFCPHPNGQIRENWARRSGPPWVICLACGYSEEGWGIGGFKLPSGYIDHMPIPEISSDELMHRRRFFRTQEAISHEKICVPSHGKPVDRSKCDGVCHG